MFQISLVHITFLVYDFFLKKSTLDKHAILNGKHVLNVVEYFL